MPISSLPATNISYIGTPPLKERFPALVKNPDVIYFDNGATTQVPNAVLSAVHEYAGSGAANPGRGSYDWADDANEYVQECRSIIANFIGLSGENGVVFTSGTTMSLNMVAQSWGRHVLMPGDEILLCLSDHHSMTLPWEELAKEKQLVIRPYHLHANGSINLSDLQGRVTDKTKLCCVTHINNTAGWINNLTAIRDILPEHVFLNVDAAQGISHVPIQMDRQGIDFLSFSGHKMFAFGGIGALCISKRVQDNMRPLFYGGGMAEYAKSDPIYKKLEAGTLNVAGIVSLSAACKFIEDTRAQNPLSSLTRHLYTLFLSNPRIDLLYEQKPYALDHLSGILSFTLEGFDSGEVADILNEYGIFVRAGRHCAGVKDSVRISLQIYNTEDEINTLYNLLETIYESHA